MTAQSSPRHMTLSRLNATIADCLLALWPEENRSWGIAFHSEFHAIESPQTQFRWLLGGIPILLRETFHSFLRSLGRPIGIGPSGLLPANAPNGRSPRTPRGVLLALLLIVTALLAQSPTRAVFRSVSQSYTFEGWDPSHWPEVQRIHSLAEKSITAKDADPHLLAFASLTFTEEEKRLAYADAAIHADPKLAWVDYQNAILPWYDVTRQHTPSADRIARLQAADPDNAILYLLRAESIALQYQQEDFKNDPGAHRVATWGAAAWSDPRWLAAMDAAFRAPRNDHYDAKLFELSRSVMARYSVNDPRILSFILGRRPIGLYAGVHKYAQVLLARADHAERAGDAGSAIQSCSLILDFAQRLRAANFFRLEISIAMDLESKTYPVLQSAYESSGRHQEALAIAGRLAQSNNERVVFAAGQFNSDRSFFRWSLSQWTAVLMQSSVLAIWILLPLSLLSIILVWVLRGRLGVATGIFHGLLCLFADFCPYLLALAAAILFVTYAPYDRVYHQSLQTPFSPLSYQEFANAAYAPFSLPPGLLMNFYSLTGPQGQLLLWSALTLVLTTIAVILVFRLRRRPTSQSH